MEELLVLLVVVAVGAGAWLFYRASSRRAEINRRESRDAERAEDRRLRGCEEVIHFFANHMGYLARETISRQELAVLIDGGITPNALASTIWDRCATTEGLVLGHHPLAEAAVPVKMPCRFRERHLYIVGKSGFGKTNLIRNLVLQDLHMGSGIGVIAPEQELLTEELLPFIPEDRWDDVVYINPADVDCPVSINPLHVDTDENLDLKVDETFTILQRIFGRDGAAPRMEQILRQTLYALMQTPDTTLLDVEKLLDRQDPSFRKWVIDQLPDEEGRHFWRSVYPAYPRDAHLSLVTRLGRFLRPEVVRGVLCAPGGSLNVREAMDEGKVLLFNLSDGILGEANAQLLGELVVAKLQLAAMSRADTEKTARRPFYLYIDEFQSFCGVAGTSYEKILSRARKYGLGLVLAHQQTGQIPENLLREILGNVSTVVCFAVGARDAGRLGREMVGELDGVPVPLDSNELLSLKIGETWCKIGRNVFYMHTSLAPDDGSPRAREEILRRSRSRYGVRVQGKARGPEAEPVSGEIPLEEIDPGEVL